MISPIRPPLFSFSLAAIPTQACFSLEKGNDGGLGSRFSKAAPYH